MAKTEKKKTTKAAPVKAVPHPIPATSKEILAKAQTKIQAPVSTLFETHIPFHNPSAQNGKAKKSGKQIKKTTPKEPSSSSSSNSKSAKEPTVQNAPSSKVDVACFATFLITYAFTGEGRFF